MKQYLIHALDAKDDKALERRLTVRAEHLENAKSLKENGNFILGGAMLNNEGLMIGSTLVLQFETEPEFELWKQNEVYILNKVWDKIEIYPFKIALV
jgi:uncharacterized protein YciI